MFLVEYMVSYDMACWVMNADGMMKCYALESNNICADTKLTKLVLVMTSLDIQASLLLMCKLDLVCALQLPVLESMEGLLLWYQRPSWHWPSRFYCWPL